MQCNFRKNFVSKRDQKLIKEVAFGASESCLLDMMARYQSIWQLAMVNCGLSPKTVERVRKEADRLKMESRTFCKEHVFDAMVEMHQKEAGILNIAKPTGLEI